MKTIVTFLFLFSALVADVRRITPEEAPPANAVCYLYLVHCTPENWREQIESVVQRHGNIQGKSLFFLLDVPEEEILSSLTALAKDHLGEEVIIATHAGVFKFLGINIPQGSLMVVEADAGHVYLRENYFKLWNLLNL